MGYKRPITGTDISTNGYNIDFSVLGKCYTLNVHGIKTGRGTIDEDFGIRLEICFSKI